jgi:hypothetical protein
METCLAQALAFAIIGVVGAVFSWLFAAGKKAITGKSTTPEQDKQLEQFGELDKFRQEHQGEAVSDEQKGID